jgi:hypothetical protein
MAAVPARSAMTMIYEDLSPCTYFGNEHEKLLAVGWLDADSAFAKGNVSSDFFKSLVELLADPWQPVAIAGRQPCSLCRFTGGLTARLGAANLFVPNVAHVFVAPSLIAHYIDAHDYCPPMQFQTAVANCPPMRSIEYLKLMRSFGMHKIGVSTQS